jgi:hypothetical protein
MKAGIPGFLILLCSCQAEQSANSTQLKASGFHVALQSEDVSLGNRPILTLSCGDAARSLWLELPPRSSANIGAQPVRGSFKVDDGPPLRVALVPLGADRWAPRLEAADEARLVSAIAAARSVYFAGPEGETDRVYRWDLKRLGEQSDLVRRGCA